uniref:Wsv161-like protein n=1 Tax=Litopenaeus vannamei majanivirus Nimav-1_LVa TaxID=2984273 RepID=A0A9C7F039_9VIRU|nr:MAG: wsv161-like protein [Litopenaeus vannamei majanivirus Nimav-1_LVa]
MSKKKVPWSILRSRIQDKNERISKEKDTISMGMNVEKTGPTSSNKQKKRTLTRQYDKKKKKIIDQQSQLNKHAQHKKNKKNIDQQSSLPSSATAVEVAVIKDDAVSLSTIGPSVNTIEGPQLSSPLPPPVLPITASAKKRNKKTYRKNSPIKRKCPTNHFRYPPPPPSTKKLPKISQIDIAKRLRKILLEEINTPIRERTLEKRRDRIEKRIYKNKVYNNMLHKLLNIDNSIDRKEIEDTRILLNDYLRTHQIDYIKNTLEERANYETLCTLLFNLFKTPQLLNKQYQSDLILIDIHESKIQELSFADYKNRLYLPIWKNMSSSIDKIIGSSDKEFAKCLQSILDKVVTFEKTITDFKKTMASVSHIHQENVKKTINNNEISGDGHPSQQSVVIKQQQELIQMQEQLIKRQSELINNNSDNSSPLSVASAYNN